MKVIRFILLLSILPLVLASCKDDDEINLGPLYLGEAADYVFFEEGSWWCYLNTVTSEKDSTVVISSLKEMRYYGCVENDNSIQKEDLALSTKSFTICRNQNYDLDQPWGCRPLNNLNSYFQLGMVDGCQSGSRSVTFFYPFDLEKGGGASQDVFFRSRYDSLQVQGKYYYDVVEFEVDIDYSQQGRRGVYYWAKNVGLIKRDKFSHIDGSLEGSWELTEYSIEQ